MYCQQTFMNILPKLHQLGWQPCASQPRPSATNNSPIAIDAVVSDSDQGCTDPTTSGYLVDPGGSKSSQTWVCSHFLAATEILNFGAPYRFLIISFVTPCANTLWYFVQPMVIRLWGSAQIGQTSFGSCPLRNSPEICLLCGLKHVLKSSHNQIEGWRIPNDLGRDTPYWSPHNLQQASTWSQVCLKNDWTPKRGVFFYPLFPQIPYQGPRFHLMYSRLNMSKSIEENCPSGGSPLLNL